jgi:hypothetical protein
MSRIRVEAYGIAPDAGATAHLVTSATKLSYAQKLDEIGTFSLEFPLTDTSAREGLQIGNYVFVFIEGEGAVLIAIVEDRKRVVSPDGSLMLQISGRDNGLRVARLRSFRQKLDNVSIGDGMTALLWDTGFIPGEVPDDTVIAREFEGATRWDALKQLADGFGYHIREDPLAATVDMGLFGDACGLTMVSPSHASPNSPAILIGNLQREDLGSQIVNRIIALAEGGPFDQVTLGESTRLYPYAIVAGQQVNGDPYQYIEDTASVEQFGAVEDVRSYNIEHLAANPTAREEAANALYDLAAADLKKLGTLPMRLSVKPIGLKHYYNGSPLLKVGQTIRVIYTGVIVHRESGEPVAVESLDEEPYIIGFSRSVAADGADDWSLDLSTAPTRRPTAAATLSKVVQEVQHIKRSGGGRWLWRQIDKALFNVIKNTSTAFETLYGGFIKANAMGLSGTLHFRLTGTYLNNTGVNQTFTVVLQFGGGNVWAGNSPAIPSSADRRPWVLEVWISNQGLPNVQIIHGRFTLGDGTSGIGLGQLNVAALIDTAIFGSATADTSLQQALVVLWQHSASNALLEVTKDRGLVDLA